MVIAAVNTEILDAEIVGEDENDVGRAFLRCGQGCREQCADDGEPREDRFHFIAVVPSRSQRSFQRLKTSGAC